MKKRYGDAVSVEYFDLANEAVRVRFPDVAKMIDDRSLPTPIVAIDGEIRMGGAVDFWFIVDVIEGKEKESADSV